MWNSNSGSNLIDEGSPSHGVITSSNDSAVRVPGRQTIVLSRTAAQIPGTAIASSPDEVGRIATGEKIFICGGEEIYRLLLPRCSEVFLTAVKRHVEGDRFLPEFETGFGPPETIEDHPDFQILHYTRRRDG